ncbi:MAG: DUF4926 domain-containing protein [Candidatus Obscuribacterales bacterium]|nr:DUF4926 domain-containing protein [Candidatus Obscuribacterales bacterium]
MTTKPKLLDVVALIIDLPERKLWRGQVGTVIECLDSDSFEIEFCDGDGRTYACLALPADQLMVLHYCPSEVA